MKFTKMQGAGNDYVYINCFRETVDDPCAFAKLVSDRRFGIGSDGLICIYPSDAADFRMDMYNADGSRGAMCGNGIRCVGKYVYEHGMTQKTEITVETLSGVRTLWLEIERGVVISVRVDMGAPSFSPRDIPAFFNGEKIVSHSIQIQGQIYEVTALSVGNPHAVIFVMDASLADVCRIGSLMEKHPVFPDGVNVEFVQVVDKNKLKMRVWERGSGETLACGTGAVASLAAACVNGLAEDKAKVILPGGELLAEWDRERNILYMTGPAVTVFDGELYI